jgi:hypothetical protein
MRRITLIIHNGSIQRGTRFEADIKADNSFRLRGESGTRAGPVEISGWITGQPPPSHKWVLISDCIPVKAGYYLGAWKKHNMWVVSELWFNPDTIGSGWWSSRDYFLQKAEDEGKTIDVVAWMNLPEYSK